MDNNKTRYYECLNITAEATREEVAAAYRQLSLKNHPMRCPREQEAQAYKMFVRINEAFEVLYDPTMKRIYDKYGEYSLKHGVMKGQDKFAGYVNQGRHYKIFEQFFGTTNPFIQDPKRDGSSPSELEQIDARFREQDIEVVLECELRELYNGCVKEVNIAYKQMLSSTEGSVVEASRFEVVVQPGFSEETKLVYSRKGHESFAAHPSDLIVKFSQKPLANFLRKGDDLIYTHTVTLLEALQMQPVAVDTLDNRKVFVAPTDVITPKTELRVAGEGMPKALTGDVVVDTTTQLLNNADRPRGDLIVRFNIVFPQKMQYDNK